MNDFGSLKTVLLASCASLVVSLFVVMSDWERDHETRSAPISLTSINIELQQRIENVEQEISSLDILLQEMLATKGTAAEIGTGANQELANRVSAIEEVIEKSRSNVHSGAENTSLDTISTNLAGSLTGSKVSGGQGFDAFSAEGEELFYQELGPSIERHEEAISDSIFSSTLVNVHDFQCTKTQCKVTYVNSDSRSDFLMPSEQSNPELELIAEISESLGDVDLDVRYAKTSDGKRVMYFSLP